MQDIFRVTGALTRSISPENRTGEPGCGGATPLEQGSARHAARDLGTGWKVNPYLVAEPGETLELAHITGEGKITQMWMTFAASWRHSILRIYWDGSKVPSVECPVGDFFCMGWGKYAQVSSLAVCVNPGSGFNCYWPMPFKKECLITMENIDEKPMTIYYQINYELGPQPADMAYFHAQFNRTNPLPYKQDYVILDGVKAAVNTSALTSPGASTTPAGGVRARSSSSWTATASIPRSAAQARRTTSAAPTTSRIR